MTATSIAAPARARSSKRLWAIVWRTIGLIFVCLSIAVLIPSNGYLGAAVDRLRDPPNHRWPRLSAGCVGDTGDRSEGARPGNPSRREPDVGRTARSGRRLFRCARTDRRTCRRHRAHLRRSQKRRSGHAGSPSPGRAERSACGAGRTPSSGRTHRRGTGGGSARRSWADDRRTSLAAGALCVYRKPRLPDRLAAGPYCCDRKGCTWTPAFRSRRWSKWRGRLRAS